MNREKILFAIVLVIAVLWGGSALLSPYEPGEPPEPGPMDVTPPNVLEGLGFATGITGDVVLVTHEHRDHNNVEMVRGEPGWGRKTGLLLFGRLNFRLPGFARFGLLVRLVLLFFHLGFLPCRASRR